jgi:tetraacyldisaccharide 4'-kinase
VAERALERRWESTSLASRAMRAALTPASWLYGAAVALRNRGYDGGLFSTHELGLPTISIGNLTVGGTGKTPIASWFAQRILDAGGQPAILLRGYGMDEVMVHRFLAPRTIVIPGADRVRTAVVARAAGATAIVLDDGFQHRRARRDADIVILSADRHRQVRLLPAGPWREPFESLRRATHVIVTRKRTTPMHAKEVLGYATRMSPRAEGAIIHLAADSLVRWGGSESKSLESLAGGSVLAIAAIGDPRAFEAQLRAASARVAMRAFRDHHAFGAGEVGRLAREAEGADFAVCTLKDAVKLGPLWPPSAPPLWYLSQRVSIELGASELEGLARRLARPATG